MRFGLLPALSTVLSLGALRALSAKVPICDRPLDYNPSVEALKVTHDCIEDVCTAGVRSARQDCGPVLLTIRSNIESDLFEPRVCIKGFRDILDQCITAGSTVTGALLTRDLRFEIAVVGLPAHEEGIRRRSALSEQKDFEDDDEYEDDDEDDGDEDDEDENDDHKRLEARKKGGRTMKSKTRKKSSKAKSKKSKSKVKSKKEKNKTNKKKGKKAKACPLRKTPAKGKGKKTTKKMTVRETTTGLLY